MGKKSVSKAQQDERVRMFTQITRAGERTAQYCLSLHDWKLDVATDAYFSNPQFYCRDGQGSASTQQTNWSSQWNVRSVEQLFNRYRDPVESEKINADGVVRLLTDLQLSPEDLKVLIFAWKCNAQVQCEFSKSEFANGMQSLDADSLEKLISKLRSLEVEMQRDVSKMKELYCFAFAYAKNPGQKSLDLEVALAYWQILLGYHFKHLAMWSAFLQEHYKHAISRDTWNLLFDFVTMFNETLTTYDLENGAWPSVIDDFVEWARPQLDSSQLQKQ